MHMADALVSPQVGVAMWGAAALTAAYCARRVREEAEQHAVPLMAVTAAFVFAAQMLNFSIPGTGSSGHLGGGLILAVLLGPHAAFLAMASVLGVQALFFGDGGLLALGANVFNLGFFPAFIAYPLIYRRIAGGSPTLARLATGGVLAAVVGLQLGSVGVVLQTVLSGVSELPFGAFIALMQPIHLAIGVVEGLVTAGVIAFVYRAQPEILTRAARRERLTGLGMRPVLAGFVAATALAAGMLAWFASPDLDGLEWSIAGVAGTPEIEGATTPLHDRLGALQEGTAVLPDYAFPSDAGAEAAEGQWPAVDAGTSTSGVVGALAVLGIVALTGLALRRRLPDTST